MQWYLIHASHAFFQKKFQRIAKLHVHPGQIPILALLSENEGMSQREIAAKLNTKPPTVNVTVRRLEKRGYVCRQADEKDQRATKVFLTDMGREITDQIKEITTDNEQVLEQGFSESELCLFKRFFQQMIDNMENME